MSETGTDDPSPTSRWHAFVDWWSQPSRATRWMMALATLLVVAGFELVVVQLGSVDARRRDADLRSTQEAIYNHALIGYNQALTNYRLCLTEVELNTRNRDQWEQLADVIAALDTGSGRAVAFADQIRHGPLLSGDQRTTADCTEPGNPPQPPGD